MVPESLSEAGGVAHTSVLDALAYDSRREMLVLVMYETRPWRGDEAHVFQLQEKLNAYSSFILDGEMEDSFPQYHGKPVEIQLRTRHEPDPLALSLLSRARDQLALQQIALETILLEDPPPSAGGCGCGNGHCHD